MSNLLSQASLVMIPSGYKEDVVYSQIPTDGSGDLSFTRASNGTRVNSAGLVEVAPWNLLQQSNSFSTSPWILLNATLTSGQTGYDGTANAWQLNDNATNGRHIIIQTPSVSGQVTFTIYAKANASNFLFIRGVQNATEVNGWFNLSTGALGTIETNGTGAIESVGNGWYKCSLTIANFENGFEFYVGLSNANGVLTYSGGSGSIFIQNAQLNIGSTAKPYFPTTDRLNVPRLTYQNGGGGCPSLLLEKQSTNLFLQSEDFSNASWTKYNTTVNANNTTSPDGTQNADKLNDIVSGSSTDYILNVTNPISYTNGTVYSVSFYAKNVDRRYMYIRFVPNAFGSNKYAYFDLQSGVISKLDSGVTATIESVGDGWYRCTATATATVTTITIYGVYIGLSNDGLNNQYVNASIKSVYIYGAQLEASSYPTSYIPTTSSSATRVADVCYKYSANSLIGQTEGTIYANVYFLDQGDGGASQYFYFNDGSSFSNAVVIGREPGSPSKYIFYIAGNGANVLFNTTNALQNNFVKMAIGYKSGDWAAYLNGNLVASGTSTFSFGSALTRLGVGTNDGSVSITASSCQFNQAILFKTRLTNAELASLTTI